MSGPSVGARGVEGDERDEGNEGNGGALPRTLPKGFHPFGIPLLPCFTRQKGCWIEYGKPLREQGAGVASYPEGFWFGLQIGDFMIC